MILTAILLATIIVGYAIAVDQSAPETQGGGQIEGYGSMYKCGSNIVFHTNISSTPQILYTVPPKHKFRIEDVVITGFSGGSVTLTRGSTGSDHMLFVEVPSGGNFDHTFDILLNSGEELGITGNGVFSYTITGRLI